MAITRAQQFRQMLKQGGEPVEQAGVMNYMPSEMVTVPKIAKSSPDTPTAKLAYITPKEEDILVDLNLYGSLDGKPNRGPGGIPSLEGDFGPGGKGSYSEAGTGRGVGKSSDKDVSAFTDKGTGKYSVSDRPEDKQTVMDYAQGKLGFQKGKKPGFFTGPGTLKQRQQIYNIQQRINAINRFSNQRKKKILSGLDQLNLSAAYDDPNETFEDLIANAPSIAGMTDKFSQKTIDDVLAGNRQIDFFTPTGSPTFDALGSLISGPVTQEKLESLLSEINTLQSIDPRDRTTKDLMKEFAPNQYRTVYPEEFQKGDGPQLPIVPIAPQASAPAEEEDYYADVGGNPFINRDAYRFFNKGGIADTVVGGEYDFESARQMYGLGKLVKKVTRTVKKIAKSPIGKAAIIGGLTFGIPGVSSGFFSKGLMGTKTGLGVKNFLANKILGTPIAGDITGTRTGGLFNLIKNNPMASIFGASALAGLMTKKSGDEDEDEDLYTGEGIDIAAIRADPFSYTPRRFASEGGSGDLSNDPNYKGWVKLYEKNPDAAMMNEKAQEYLQFYNKKAEGGSMKEPVAKKTMPLLDMGGKEMDLRAEGGFVPIGRMEKADDVPARLSKNEFVFTADAVRNAGDGDVDKGAEVMYNMMKNLESGGDVSEESQGLEGARKMFQTSQRLGEVI